jgi:hypothetical protein
MRRVVLCEGPEDITAIREIAILLFEAKTTSTQTPGAAGQPRKLSLNIQGCDVEITAGRRGKSGLPEELATKLLGLSVDNLGSAPNALQQITVLFDPDEEPRHRMYARLEEQIAAEAKSWKLEGQPGDWIARRNASETVVVRAVHWRSPGSVVDGLPDYQNLERLICYVAAKAYPQEAKMVERWLGEISAADKEPCWKAALHLWCALVEHKADERNAAARFLHQNDTCRPHVREAIQEVSLFRDLSQALGFSAATTE